MKGYVYRKMHLHVHVTDKTAQLLSTTRFTEKELVKGFGVYIKYMYVDLEQAEHSSKSSPTGLMRALISIWYLRRRLAACSAIQELIQRSER